MELSLSFVIEKRCSREQFYFRMHSQDKVFNSPRFPRARENNNSNIALISPTSRLFNSFVQEIRKEKKTYIPLAIPSLSSQTKKRASSNHRFSISNHFIIILRFV